MLTNIHFPKKISSTHHNGYILPIPILQKSIYLLCFKIRWPYYSFQFFFTIHPISLKTTAKNKA